MELSNNTESTNYYEIFMENIKNPENKNKIISSAVITGLFAVYGTYKLIQRRGRWTQSDIPDLNTRVYVVTGASSGIGITTVRFLAEHGATVVLAVRNVGKGEEVAKVIVEGCGECEDRLIVMQLDLGSMESIAKFSEEFHDRFLRLDGLVNNAGVMMIEEKTKTVDGLEMQIGVNHFGHFELTGRLLDCLINTEGSRVVNVSSSAHAFAKEDNVEDWDGENYESISAYARSKAANILFTLALQRKFEEAKVNVTATSCHPGWTATALQTRDHISLAKRLAMKIGNTFLAQGTEMGCLPTLYALLKAEPGQFIGPNGMGTMTGYPTVEEPIPLVQDQQLQERLWNASLERTSVTYELLQ